MKPFNLQEIEDQLDFIYPTVPWTLQIELNHMFLYDGEGTVVCSYERTQFGIWFSIFDLFPIKQFKSVNACIQNAKKMAGKNGLEVLNA